MFWLQMAEKNPLKLLVLQLVLKLGTRTPVVLLCKISGQQIRVPPVVRIAIRKRLIVNLKSSKEGRVLRREQPVAMLRQPLARNTLRNGVRKLKSTIPTSVI